MALGTMQKQREEKALKVKAQTGITPIRAHESQNADLGGTESTAQGSVSSLPAGKWPLAATNDGSKFRALKICDRIISSTDGVVYSSETLSEVLGRPDDLNVNLRFTNIVGTPTVTLSIEVSADGVSYKQLFTSPFAVTGVVKIPRFSAPLSARVRLSLSFDTGSADVRAYVRSVLPGRRRLGVRILDKVLVGNSPYYSEAEFNDMLGRVDVLSFLLFPNQVSGISPTISIVLEESPDGIDWATNSALLTNMNLPVSSEVYFASNLPQPPSKFVRLRVTLGGTNPTAAVRIEACGRGQ